jgi:ATP-dependent DNA helicase RecG
MYKKTTVGELNQLVRQTEDVHLEFKAAKSNFDKDRDLVDYCAALANEGGGKLVLGVDAKGKIVGSRAFEGTWNKLSHELYTKIKIRVQVEEVVHPQGRVLIFHVPTRPLGQLVISTGKYKYPMRAGESLVEMDLGTLKRIFSEVEPDFSCQIVPSLSVSDLDKVAVNNFRQKWAQKSRRKEFLSFPDEKILSAAGILSEKGINYAGLVLFGKEDKIKQLLSDSEIIFEWRQKSESIAYDFRCSWRAPFFKVLEEIWKEINNRNSRIPFQEGLFQREILAFNEKAVREALLNAVAHRDYSIRGQSIFIKASPKTFEILSPGGFPMGITLENILFKTHWRNRCIAETFEKAGLVERSGQGMDDIFTATIREGKGLPDLSATDSTTVILRIPAQVQDRNFIVFLEKIQSEKGVAFSFEEILQLEMVRAQQKVSDIQSKKKFLDLGIIERIGRTSGSKYMLAHKYYNYEKRSGVYTRLVGVPREKQKEFILQHLRKNKKAKREELFDIFPELVPMDVSNLLQEMRRDGKISHKGAAKTGWWEIMK